MSDYFNCGNKTCPLCDSKKARGNTTSSNMRKADEAIAKLTAPPAECGYCHWWVRWGSVMGDCQRHPPSLRGFSATHETSFCGEFKARGAGIAHT